MSGSNGPVGAFVFTTGGNTNAGSGYVVTTPASGSFTYDSGAIQWTQFSAAGAVSAGAGLSQTGSVLSIESGGVLQIGHGGTGASSGTAALTALGGDSRYANVFSPMAYGAVGDGTTDDTTALQACISAACRSKRDQWTWARSSS